MSTRYVILRPGQPPQIGAVDWPRSPGFAAIQALVRPILDGGDLEHVSVLYDGKATDLFVDEIGAIKALPRNEKATAIYRAYTMSREPKRDPETLPAIFGPAVLMMRRVWR